MTESGHGALTAVRGRGVLAAIRHGALAPVRRPRSLGPQFKPIRAALTKSLADDPVWRRNQALFALLEHDDIATFLIDFGRLPGRTVLEWQITHLPTFGLAIAETIGAFDEKRQLSKAIAWAEELARAIGDVLEACRTGDADVQLATLARGCPDLAESPLARVARDLTARERLLVARAKGRGWAGNGRERREVEAIRLRLRRRLVTR